MECENGTMSLAQPKELIFSPINSLGGGDTSFQAVMRTQTQKLSFSSSPVQIIRKRYWCNPHQRNLFSIVSRNETEKVFLAKEAKKTIHMSLEDLSDYQKHTKDYDHIKSTSCIMKKSNNSFTGQKTMPKTIDKEKAQAARRIFEALMLNAWRKRKEDGEELTKMIYNMTSELDRYQMKLHLLKSILKNETERSEYAMKEIATFKSGIQDYERTIEAMKEEKEKLVLVFEDKQTALQEQLAKDMETLNKLREEIKHTLDKVGELEESLSTKNKWIERMNESNQKEKEMQAFTQQKLEEEVESEKSRNKELLREIERLVRYEILYERRLLEELNDNKESVFAVLAKNILSRAGRIPLALFLRITYAFWPFSAYDSVQLNS